MVNYGILSAFIFTVVACSLGGRLLEHYFMIFVPLLVIPYAYLFVKIKESLPKTKYIFLFILFILYNFNFISMQDKVIRYNYSEKGYGLFTMRPSTMEKLKEIIIQNTKTTDKILVRGNQCSVYLYSDRTCATRFPYPLEDSSLSKKYYVEDIARTLPKLIIQGYLVNPGDSFNLDTLLNEKYQLIENDIGDVEIWKLKE